MTLDQVVSFVALIGLMSVHAGAGSLHALDRIPRSRWLSAAGGISVVYVFLNLLPELAGHQDVLVEAAPPLLSFLEHHVWLMALTGLACFYGLESLAKRSRRQQLRREGEDRTHPWVFGIHMASFSAYNFLIGYMVVEREAGRPVPLALYTIAMAVHFLVVDHGLSADHKHLYTRFGRWLLIVMLLIGWLVGQLSGISEVAQAVLIAFLAGGIVLNVMKEELPEERQSRYSAFIAGGAVYAVLLLAAQG